MKTSFTTLLAILIYLSVNAQTFYKGVDLSYVNQMEDCGAIYYDGGTAGDPFQIMADHGANIVRVRLWHTPEAWTAFPSSYSGYNDVVTTITRARSRGMSVLLDFHYSDTWVDPGKQAIPSAWASLVNNTPALETKMYDYTYQVLSDLDQLGLMPEFVQVGNETNGSMLFPEGANIYPIDWNRQSAIINAGIAGVRAAGNNSTIQPKVVLHIANPVHGDGWFGSAVANGVTDFDIMGFSLYPEWHGGNIGQTGDIVEYLRTTYNKDVMLVEVGLPWTDASNDAAGNILSQMPSGYGVPSPAAQRNWLVDITTEVHNRGGIGVIYWEPAWVSTGCDTEWGTGSHYENATFFDFNNELITDGGVQFLEQSYGAGVNNVTFSVDMTGVSGGSGAYVTGNFTGSGSWQIIPMVNEGGNIYTYSTSIPVGTTGAYYFLKNNTWGDRETVPAECALQWGTDREYTIQAGQNVLAFPWGSCTPMTERTVTFRVDMTGVNGAQGAYVTGDFTGANWQILSMTHEGNNIYSYTTTMEEGATGGYYFLKRNKWSFRETVPSECALAYGTDRQYTITGTNNTFAFGWESCDQASARVVTAIGLPSEGQELSVYPNPVADVLYLENSSYRQYSLMNLSGATLLSGTLSRTDQISMDGLPKGIYILRLTGAGTEVIRVVKE